MWLQGVSSHMEPKLNDLIHIHDNVLEPEICEKIIKYFENNSELHERIENNKIPNFTQLNLTENCKKDSEIDNIHNYLISKVFEYKKRYYAYVDERCFPIQNQFEQFRIKKYFHEKEDQFDTHVDVTDYASARRFLSFMWYLNDVNEGGETQFRDLTIEAKCGRLVIFPPLWMYPHRGCPPIGQDKYILSTYLHYK